MGHGPHPDRRADVSRKLILATAATIVFVVIGVVVGWWSNSLALIGDALHNFTDSLALVLALVAVRFERRKPTSSKSYGYQRAGILAAFVNAGTLLGITAYLFVEAFDRFRDPRPVNELAMIATALAGVVLNVVITVALRKEGQHDLNIRAAVIHMIGDAISSIGIIIAAVMIRATGSTLWDPAISLLIGAMIVWSSWGILRETVNLLLEGTPQGIDPDDVTRSIAELEGVEGVHHVHIWAIGSSSPALSCHLMVGDVPIRNTAKLLDRVNAMLEERYHITHTTIQFEFANCSADDPYCVPWPRQARHK